MGFSRPQMPDFDPIAWLSLPYAQRARLACRDWALRGFGAPVTTYLFYVVKVAVYVGGWFAITAMTEGLGGPGSVGEWWSDPLALQKAALWTMAWEGLGLGAASGPLTGRYWPPFAAMLHFARPGTTRLPPWPDRVPVTAGWRRSGSDVALYLAHYAFLGRALFADDLAVGVLLPVVLLLPLLGLRDKTAFLASRPEHYLTLTVVFLFPADVLPGAQIVAVAIWFWAATSKLNHHFGPVIAVMISNHPLLRWRRLRTAMYRAYPDDLRPSRLAGALGHVGTAVEYTFPLLLVLGDGGPATVVGLVLMTVFHTYIFTSVPMGVPVEWNVFVPYAAFVLFGAHADVSPWDLSSPLLAAILLVVLVVVPLYGNLRPDRVSFLPAMRYYAGNWAYSQWLFRGDEAVARFEDSITKAARDVLDQVGRFFDEDVIATVVARATAFRLMHLPARALHDVLPQAVDDLDGYQIRDGEIVAGLVLGWNFGDGHLHHEGLLAAVQAQCGFAPGQLRCVFVESQPLGRPTLHWRVHDAADGLLAEGLADVRKLLEEQPWPSEAV